MFLHDQDGSDQRRAGREESTELLGEEARVGEFQVLFIGSSSKVLIGTEFWMTMTNDGFRYLQIGPAGVSYRWNWVTIDLIDIIIVDMKKSAKLGGLLPHWPDPRAGEQTEPRKQICRFSCQASLLPRVSHPFSMMSP